MGNGTRDRARPMNPPPARPRPPVSLGRDLCPEHTRVSPTAARTCEHPIVPAKAKDRPVHRTVKGDATRILASSLAASFFAHGTATGGCWWRVNSRNPMRRVAVRASCRLLVPVRPGPAGRSVVAIRPCVRRYHRPRYSYFSKGAPTHACVLLIDRNGPDLGRSCVVQHATPRAL